jgi:hypothetical protein
MSEADIHYAERDKERDIAITDNVFDHHLDEDIGNRKKALTGQSENDMGRYRYR